MDKQQEPRLRFKGFTGAWEEKRLSDVVEIVGGGTPDTNNSAYWGGEIDWYSPTEIGENVYANGSIRKITLLGLQKSSAVILPADRTVLFTSRASIGDMAILTKQGATNQGFQSFIVREGLNIYFLYTMGFKIKEYALKNASGSTFLEISKTQLLQMESLFPSLPEQTHLGLFFRRLDSQIAESRAVLEKSRQLKKAMLAKMFPANGEKIPKIRFKGFEGEWECRKLRDLMNVTSVKRIHQSDWTNEGVRFLRARDIVAFNKGERIEEPLFISKEKYNEYSELSGKVKIGDLLVTGVGTIGVPYLIEDEDPLYFKDGNVIWFQNENKIGGLFFYYSFLNNFIQDFIIETAGIGTVGTYTIDTGKKTPIFLPPTKSEQTAIGLFFRQLDETIALQSAEIEKLNQLKKGLLAAMLV